jgi:cyclopropane fatty-acyl-phospholipid synthase-like methyltransferase
VEDWKYRQILSATIPISSERLDDFVEAFALPPGATVIDIGCGDGTLMVALARRYGARCIGTDDRPTTLASARQRAAGSGVADLVTTVHQDGFAFSAIPGSFDAALCLGGTWILGGYRRTLARLAQWTRPGGLIGIGETFAFDPPEATYFRGRTLAVSAFRSHQGNIAIGLEEGLEPVNCWIATADEWNSHHESQFAAARRWLDANPDDEDRPEVKSRAEAAERGFHHHDRSEQRWAAYLSRKPVTRG